MNFLIILGIVLGLAVCPGRISAQGVLTAEQIERDWLNAESLHQAGGTAAAVAMKVTPEQDAAGGCDGAKNGGWGFHTADEERPWWQVDLGEPVPLDKALLYNRCDGMAGRNSRIQVLLSEDGKNFRQAYQHDGNTFYGHTDQKPLAVALNGAKARYLRLQLPGKSYFHLDEVEVFARGEGKNVALGKSATQSSVSQWSSNHLAKGASAKQFPVAQVVERGEQLAANLRKMGVNVDAESRNLREVRMRLAAMGKNESVEHALSDDDGPFLGLGVSYMTALWRCRNNRSRVESDLAFLSRQGFNYYRMLSMVGWWPAWDGLEIAPVSFTSRAGKRVEAWPDYWQQLITLIDLAYDKYGLRTQITIFADAQLMPAKQARLEHMRQLLEKVVRGREHKIILLEVANEAWQNGFTGDAGVADLREFTAFLAERTEVPVATTSNHEDDFAKLYANSAADIATWHFSRDRQPDDGWKPVYDCWEVGNLPGFPPVSSNEPIGPGSSVAAEKSPIRLVMAAAFAYAAKLPMYVFHSEAGVFGKTRFEDTVGVSAYQHLKAILPPDLPNWQRNDGKEKDAPFTAYAGGKPNCYWPEAPASRDGCVRNIGSRKNDQFVCVPIGIRQGGLELAAREDLQFQVFDPLSGKVLQSPTLKTGERITLPAGPGALIIKGRRQHTSP